MNLKINRLFDRFSSLITHFAGSSIAFGSAFCLIIIWLITGPVFHYSDTWQLIINTGTTIITFLMVFLIQRSQNKDSIALQLKLNELIAATKGASNSLIDIESLTEEQLDALHKYFSILAEQTKNQSNIKRSHSIASAKAQAKKLS
ncbi:MAG TPA: low affinity iron permease family protein [Ignavibacteriaceae bacterium]|nr:low affinity iron permease family protein [Ignavibacteriaceae bacterium]